MFPLTNCLIGCDLHVLFRFTHTSMVFSSATRPASQCIFQPVITHIPLLYDNSCDRLAVEEGSPKMADICCLFMVICLTPQCGCIKRPVLFWGGAAIVWAVKETRGCWQLKDMRWIKIDWHFLCGTSCVVFNIIHSHFTDLRHHGCNKLFAKVLFNVCFVLN